MTPEFVGRVWDADYKKLVHLFAVEGGLELIVDVSDKTAESITLDPAAVKRLRLALQRYERTQK